MQEWYDKNLKLLKHKIQYNKKSVIYKIFLSEP